MMTHFRLGYEHILVGDPFDSQEAAERAAQEMSRYEGPIEIIWIRNDQYQVVSVWSGGHGFFPQLAEWQEKDRNKNGV